MLLFRIAPHVDGAPPHMMSAEDARVHHFRRLISINSVQEFRVVAIRLRERHHGHAPAPDIGG
jgi:hypothetical protein